jgi:putative transposase
MDQTIRLMFLDEAGFGRINKPKMCWCPKGVRPSVPCHHIREYEYLYGAVEPMTGENFFLIMPYCNTNHMNAFLRELSAAYPKDYILLVTDGAAWHSAKALVVPENIKLLRIPPYTPEMNPIEQIWKYLRSVGFRDEVFRSLADDADCLRGTAAAPTDEIVSNIPCRERIELSFLD